MSGEYNINNMRLSERWNAAPQEVREKVLSNTQALFRLLNEKQIGDEAAKQEARHILHTQAEYIDTQATISPTDEAEEKDMSAFHLIAKANIFKAERDYSLIEDFVEAGFPIDQKDAEGCTALIRSALYNKFEAVDALALHGANVHATLADGVGKADYPLLQYALNLAHYDVASVLLRYGADCTVPYISSEGEITPFTVGERFCHPIRCHTPTVAKLLWYGLDPLREIGAASEEAANGGLVNYRDNIAATMIELRGGMSGSSSEKNSVMQSLLNAGVPVALAEKHIGISKFEDDHFAEITAKAKAEGERLWQDFEANRDYETLDLATLIRFANIGKLDTLIKDPSLWRTKQRAEIGMELVDALPLYLQRKYKSERSLMEEAVQTKQTGWSR